MFTAHNLCRIRASQYAIPRAERYAKENFTKLNNSSAICKVSRLVVDILSRLVVAKFEINYPSCATMLMYTVIWIHWIIRLFMEAMIIFISYKWSTNSIIDTIAIVMGAKAALEKTTIYIFIKLDCMKVTLKTFIFSLKRHSARKIFDRLLKLITYYKIHSRLAELT